MVDDDDAFTVAMEGVTVSLTKGTIRLAPSITRPAQSLALGFSMAVMYLLVQPRHKDMAMALKMQAGSKKVNFFYNHST